MVLPPFHGHSSAEFKRETLRRANEEGAGHPVADRVHPHRMGNLIFLVSEEDFPAYIAEMSALTNSGRTSDTYNYFFILRFIFETVS